VHRSWCTRRRHRAAPHTQRAEAHSHHPPSHKEHAATANHTRVGACAPHSNHRQRAARWRRTQPGHARGPAHKGCNTAAPHRRGGRWGPQGVLSPAAAHPPNPTCRAPGPGWRQTLLLFGQSLSTRLNPLSWRPRASNHRTTPPCPSLPGAPRLSTSCGGVAAAAAGCWFDAEGLHETAPHMGGRGKAACDCQAAAPPPPNRGPTRRGKAAAWVPPLPTSLLYGVGGDKTRADAFPATAPAPHQHSRQQAGGCNKLPRALLAHAKTTTNHLLLAASRHGTNAPPRHQAPGPAAHPRQCILPCPTSLHHHPYCCLRPCASRPAPPPPAPKTAAGPRRWAAAPGRRRRRSQLLSWTC
jgi:hypothetical protein